MGSPITYWNEVQTVNALTHFKEMISIRKSYELKRFMGGTLIRREPIGVCGVITPWNWPLNKVTSKLAPAIASGCTSVLKPSEIAPLSSILFMEILHEAGVPQGDFNLVNGDGPIVGEAISGHPGIDMASFTGSTSAGILVAKGAASTVKRVVQELGGKSANIILPDADLQKAIPAGVLRCFTNTGQSCQAPTRMLVHRSQRDEVIALAKKAAEQVKVGDPLDPKTTMGPLVSKAQFDKVQGLIERGIGEGATTATGGGGRPAGLNRGYFARPTVFADVTPDMTIAKEEIFGPVLSMITMSSRMKQSRSPRARPTGWRICAGRRHRPASAASRASSAPAVSTSTVLRSPQRPVRRLQAIRQRPRARRVRLRGISRGEAVLG